MSSDKNRPTFDELAEEYANEVDLDPDTYPGDVATAFVPGMMKRDEQFKVDLNMSGKFGPFEIENSQSEQPPIGITPQKFWIEDRLAELDKAISRYMDTHKPVPVKWIEERNEHINRLYELDGIM